MPNTLAHFGLQSIVSKISFHPADIKWIGLGCVIPDLPWILQRLIHPLHIVSPIHLRLYAIIQATLLFSLLLGAAVSLQIKGGKKVFMLLAVNIVLHLLLDPTQTKWANGTHLLAPFSWKLLHLDWYWPEQLPSLLLTGLGLLLFAYWIWQDRHAHICFTRSRIRRIMGAGLLALYLILPLALFKGPFTTDNHFTATLISADKTGQLMEIDRKPYRNSDHTIATYTNARFELQGDLPDHDAILSIKGRFSSNSTILVSKYHVHNRMRDIFSVAGLALLLLSWLFAVLQKRITIEPSNTIKSQQSR